MTKKLNYGDYLEIPRVISSQHPISAEHGKPAHIEMLYIVVHQVYELWFKAILHELGSVITMFERDFVNERNIGIAVTRLRRVEEIQKLLNQQIAVLETMTPLDFLDFRRYLGTASGFQSYQFRILENRLGLLRKNRLRYSGKEYVEDLEGEQRKLVEESEQQTSMFDVLEQWLERTPFLDQHFDFRKAYCDAIERMSIADRDLTRNDNSLSEEERNWRLTAIDTSAADLVQFFDPQFHQKQIQKGFKRLSHRATIAALFISLYRDEPMLQQPYQVIESLINIDENFTVWRSQHAVMVHRMLGRKMGTGKSSGFEYLKETVEKSRVFTDLFNLSTFLIPRSDLPELPNSLRQHLAFHYSVETGAV